MQPNDKPHQKPRYEELGASATKAGIHETLTRSGVDISHALFAPATSDFAGDSRYVSFLHCDGAGTKSIPAYLLWKETGDAKCFQYLADDALVMNLDDVYCTGAPESIVLANTIARNARLIPDEVVGLLVQRYRFLTEMLQSHGVPIHMSGGETADVGDVVRTLLVDAVVAARTATESLVNAMRIQPGDVIIGLASFGRSNYEEIENSGIGSNGLTLARHVLLKRAYSEQYPEILDTGLISEHLYAGPYGVLETPPELQTMNIGTALTSPTRTFAPLLHKLLHELGADIHGLIHNTGGGLTKVLRFGRGNHYIKDNLFTLPGIFSLVQETGNVSWNEMYQVFNCGQRLEIYVPERRIAEVLDVAKSFAIPAQVIGRVESNPDQTSNQISVHAQSTEHYSLKIT